MLRALLVAMREPSGFDAAVLPRALSPPPTPALSPCLPVNLNPATYPPPHHPTATITITPKVVNALSKWVRVEVVRGGKRHSLSFERGKTQGDLVTEEAGADAAGGTAVRFMPDPEVREKSTFSHTSSYCRLKCQPVRVLGTVRGFLFIPICLYCSGAVWTTALAVLVRFVPVFALDFLKVPVSFYF